MEILVDNHDDFDSAMLSRFFLESLMLISDKSIFSEPIYNTKDVSKEIIGHLICGIAKPEGTDLINYYKINTGLER